MSGGGEDRQSPMLRAGRIVDHLLEALLAFALMSLIALSCLQILLRLFDNGLFWIDPLLRHLVVWGGFFGAVAAVRRRRHISLDVSEFLLPPRLLAPFKIAGQLCGAVVCGFLAYASSLFIRSEMEFGGADFLSLPSWIWNLVFPLAFAAMSLSFLIAAFTRDQGRKGFDELP